jgi:hypothetical protein
VWYLRVSPCSTCVVVHCSTPDLEGHSSPRDPLFVLHSVLDASLMLLKDNGALGGEGCHLVFPAKVCFDEGHDPLCIFGEIVCPFVSYRDQVSALKSWLEGGMNINPL